jgi:glycosyltransferase involved in cell wall biosynthesis
LAAADILLFTTLHQEGLPLNILESLAAGLPVVVSQHLLPHLAISQGIYGINPKDRFAVAEGIERGISAALGKQKQSLLPEQFSLSYCAKQYYDLISQPVVNIAGKAV